MVMGGGYGSPWPEELGQPSSSGSQNNLRYAFFPSTQRLAIDVNGQITVYDTGNHQIGGVSQQQSGDQSITFTSQFGTVRCADLPVVQVGQHYTAPDPSPSFTPPPEPAPVHDTSGRQDTAPVQPQIGPQTQAPAPSGPSSSVSSVDIFAMIEQLANLHEKGILNDDEFSAKKAELLARL
jgi:hypothetical protein